MTVLGICVDTYAIAAEVEQLQDSQPGDTVVQPKRPRAGRKMLLHFLHSPHPCSLSPTVTGSSAAHLPAGHKEHRQEPEACTCGHCGKNLVKIGDDCMDAGGRAPTVGALGDAGAVAEDVTEQRDVEPAKFFVHRHLCPAGISVPNMPAALAKPSPPPPSRPP